MLRSGDFLVDNNNNDNDNDKTDYFTPAHARGVTSTDTIDAIQSIIPDLTWWGVHI